jgi:hypothetical protein
MGVCSSDVTWNTGGKTLFEVLYLERFHRV